jgi:hypothetical protein
MPTVTKANPTLRNVGHSFNGKTVQAYTVDLAVDGTNFAATELGAEGAIQEVYEVLTLRVTPLLISALRSDGSNDGQVFDIYFEGEFPSDDYGYGEQTFAEYLQAELRARTAAGSNDIDLSSATVNAMTGSPFFADDIVADY